MDISIGQPMSDIHT